MKNNTKSEFIYFLILGFIVVIAMLSIAPFLHPVPHRDSGVFLYVGSQINSGKLPYLDAWDHKPPLIYYIDALGLLIAGNQLWGVWLIELFFMIALVVIGYLSARQFLQPFVSFAITAGVFLTVFQFFGGNFTEEYAILFEVICLYLFIRIEKLQKPMSASFLLGLFTGLGFCMKAPYIDVALCVSILWVFMAIIKNDISYIKRLLWLAGGFVIVNSIAVLIFLAQHNLEGYWQAAYVYNFAYASEAGLVEKAKAVLDSIEEFLKQPWLFLAFVIWFIELIFVAIRAIPRLFKAAQQKMFRFVVIAAGLILLVLFASAQVIGKSPGIGAIELIALVLGTLLIFAGIVLFSSGIQRNLAYINNEKRFHLADYLADSCNFPSLFVLFSAINFPLSIILVSLSGRNYTDYYIMLLPAVMMVFISGVELFFKMAKTELSKKILAISLFSLLVISAYPPLMSIGSRLQKDTYIDPKQEVATYLDQNSEKSDTVLVWGAATVINFLSDRESPTRYSYQYPVYLESKLQPKIIRTIYNDLQTKPPLFIVDTLDSDTPFIENNSMTECLKKNPSGDSEDLSAILNYVCSNYQLDTQIGGMNIYKFVHTGK